MTKKPFFQNFFIRISSALSIVFLVLGAVFVLSSYVASEPTSLAGVLIIIFAVTLAILAIALTNLALFNLNNEIRESTFLAEKIANGEIFYGTDEKDSSELKSSLKLIAAKLSERSKQIERIASGDSDIEFELYSEADVLGQAIQDIKGKFRSLIQTNEERENLRRSIQNLLAKTSQIMSGDYAVRLSVFSSEVEPAAKAFNAMVRSLNDLMSKIKHFSEDINVVAKRLNDSAERLERENELQVGLLSQASMKLTQLTGQIQKTAEMASATSQSWEDLTAAVKYGLKNADEEQVVVSSLRKLTQETTKKSKKLGERSQEIQQLVDLLMTLRDKVNLLTLNIKIIESHDPSDKLQSFVQEVVRVAEQFEHFTNQIQGFSQTMQGEIQELVISMEEIIHEVILCSTLSNRTRKAFAEANQALSNSDETTKELADVSVLNFQLSEDITRLNDSTVKSNKSMQGNIKQLSSLIDDILSSSGELSNTVAAIRTSESEGIAKKTS